MIKSSILDRQDDQTLAALSVQALRMLAHRRRHSRLYDVFEHAADGAAVAESLTLPDRPADVAKRK